MVNLPTFVTLSRILLIPLFVFAVGPRPLLGTFIFILASVTDLLDGYLARRSKQITKIGVLLDPIADKLLVISALIVLVDIEFVEAWIAIIIIAREFMVTGLRIVALSREIVISAEIGGKIKTTAQFVSIFIFLIDYSFNSMDLYVLGSVLLWIAMLLGLVSGIQYFIQFWKQLS